MADTPPYIEKKPGELIRAEDWNAIQSRVREDLQSHTHAGEATGLQISYHSLTDMPTEFHAASHKHIRADLDLGELLQTLVLTLSAPRTGLNLSVAGTPTALDGTLLVNTIPSADFESATKQIKLPAGLYLLTFSYQANTSHASTPQAGTPQARAQPTWSSYFVDFPNQRLYTTAVHNPGGTSDHSGSLTYTALLSQPTTIPFHLGRGPSGNYTGPINLLVAQLTIFRLGEAIAIRQH